MAWSIQVGDQNNVRCRCAYFLKMARHCSCFRLRRAAVHAAVDVEMRILRCVHNRMVRVQNRMLHFYIVYLYKPEYFARRFQYIKIFRSYSLKMSSRWVKSAGRHAECHDSITAVVAITYKSLQGTESYGTIHSTGTESYGTNRYIL